MVTLSMVVIFGILTAFLLKFRALGFGAFLAAALFGFYLAQTPAADTVNEAARSVVDAVSSIGSTGGDGT